MGDAGLIAALCPKVSMSIIYIKFVIGLVESSVTLVFF